MTSKRLQLLILVFLYSGQHALLQPSTEMQLGPYVCKLCNIRYETQSSLTRHVNKKHKQANYPVHESFQCELSDKRFKSNRRLLYHVRYNHLRRRLKCDEFGDFFVEKLYLGRHKGSVHSEERPFHCETYGKGFTRKWYMEHHIRDQASPGGEGCMKRQKDNRFQCEKCGEEFTKKQNKERHVQEQASPDGGSCAKRKERKEKQKNDLIQ